jgi:hypothetical protein
MVSDAVVLAELVVEDDVGEAVVVLVVLLLELLLLELHAARDMAAVAATAVATVKRRHPWRLGATAIFCYLPVRNLLEIFRPFLSC